MKKLSKILVTALLSASMCVSGFLAVNTLKANTNVDAAPITMSQYAGAIKTTGAGASATYVENEKQLKVNTTFTGIKLTGDSNATFDLGTFDIGSSDWAGTYNATGAPDANNKNQSLLEMVFAPHDDKEFTSSTSGGTGELSNVTFTISQGNKSIDVRFAYYSYTGDVNGHEISITTKTESQSDYASYRSNKDALISGGTRRGMIYAGSPYNPANPTDVRPNDLANLGLSGNVDLYAGSWGTSTTTASVYYDFNDKALYTPSLYISKADGLNDSYLLRDYDSTIKKTNSTTDTVTAWSGFEKDASGSCLVNVTAKFGLVNGDNGSSVIVTKLGNTVFNANVDSIVNVKESITAIANDTYNVADFLSLDYFGSNMSFPVSQDYINSLTIKVGADETSATLLEGTTEYAFTETANVYFYEGETLIGTTAVVVTDEIVSNVNVTSGKAFYKRGDAEKVEITNGTVLKIGDVITFEGGKHDVTGDDIEDIKNLIIDGNEIQTVTDNVALSVSEYSYVITADDLRGKSLFDLTAVLDNYCDVTVVDEYDGTTVLYGWQSIAGSVTLPYSSIFNGGYNRYGASNGEKFLIGYGRDDGYTLKGNGDIEDWGYLEGSEGSALYRVTLNNDRKLNVESGDADAVLEKYECITKGMQFTALYVGVEVHAAINSTTGKLNIIADYNQEDCMRWEKYSNLDLKKSVHAKISIRYSIVTDTSYDVLNAAYDKTKDEAFNKPEENKSEADKKITVKDIGYKYNTTAYMVTGANVQKIGGLCRVTLPVIENLQEGQYIAYGAVISLQSCQGGATCNASKTYYLSSADYNEKAIASQIIADGNIYSTEAGKGYNFAINVGGVNKYSKYTLTDLKKLYEIAENTTELTAWVEQTA